MAAVTDMLMEDEGPAPIVRVPAPRMPKPVAPPPLGQIVDVPYTLWLVTVATALMAALARATVEAEVPDGRASATTLVSRSTSFQSRVTPTRVQPAEGCTRTMNDGDEPVAAGTWTGEDLVRGI